LETCALPQPLKELSTVHYSYLQISLYVLMSINVSSVFFHLLINPSIAMELV
jgi:hypothetical protein